MENKTELNHLVIRVSKEDSAFVYFQLEANEGLCFYSTLPTKEVGQNFRDLEFFNPISLQKEFFQMLDALKKIMSITILVQEVINER